MLGLNPRFGAGFKEPSEPFMPERLDHALSIARCAPRNNLPKAPVQRGPRGGPSAATGC